MKRLAKQDYMSENTKQLEVQLKEQIKEDKKRASAKRRVEQIPIEERQYVLEELSLQLAAK